MVWKKKKIKYLIFNQTSQESKLVGEKDQILIFTSISQTLVILVLPSQFLLNLHYLHNYLF